MTGNLGAPWHWAAFIGLVLGLLSLDLGVFHRKSREVSLRSAAVWSGVWVALAAAFNYLVFTWFGAGPALEFATGYVIEKALAVDNIFVFVVIFSAFSVPLVHQHRVLFWGILGALVMRAGFVALGGAVLARFHWALYFFGAFLAFTGIKLLRSGNEPADPDQNPIIKTLKRWIPTASGDTGGHFWVRAGGKWMATPLLLALVAVELSDVVFAVDSIPAIFAVTQEPFIVFTSNIFAILGLRSLYFLLAGIIDRFVHLKTGLAAVLLFVGAKMLLADVVVVPVLVSLCVIVGMLAVAVVASLLGTKRLDAKMAGDSTARRDDAR